MTNDATLLADYVTATTATAEIIAAASSAYGAQDPLEARMVAAVAQNAEDVHHGAQHQLTVSDVILPPEIEEALPTDPLADYGTALDAASELVAATTEALKAEDEREMSHLAQVAQKAAHTIHSARDRLEIRGVIQRANNQPTKRQTQ